MEDKLNKILSATETLREEFEDSKENSQRSINELDEKFNSLDCLEKEKIAKINEFLDQVEKENQENQKKNQIFENRIKELEQSNSELTEKLLEKVDFEGNDKMPKNLIETFGKILKLDNSVLLTECRDEIQNFTEASNNTLRTDINSKGGFNVHSKFASQIFKEAEEESIIEPYCTVYNQDKKSILVPIERETEDNKDFFVNEAMDGEETSAAFDQVEIVTNRQSATIPITRDLLLFSDFDIVNLIVQKIAKKLGKGVARAIIGSSRINSAVVDRTNAPEGILLNDKVETIETIDPNSLSFDDVIGFPNVLKSAYINPNRSKYYLNLKTLFYLRLLKDGDGRYLWKPDEKGFGNINSFPYVILPDLSDIAAAKFPIFFGDLKSAYVVVHNSNLQMIKDEYSSKRKALIEYTFDRWVGGRVVLPEAICKLKVKNNAFLENPTKAANQLNEVKEKKNKNQ